MEQPAPRAAPSPDRETAARDGDHHALRLWLRLFTCTQLIERRVRARLRERFDTTLPRFDLMSQLFRYPAGLRMKELSRHLMVTGGNVTGIVDQLEREGLVERADEPADRRAWRVRLTRAGRRGFAEMAREHEVWIAGLLAGLTRREHAEAYRLLGRVKRVTLEAGS
ncbi:MAG TPA: MarR family transcriptional regulator [Burkholderiales bacterium]|nr:MarR family transcriptional regulator [Burkholderiales bacterium]